jgi:hypothetical protein
MPSEEFFPAGIPHPSLSPPGNHSEKKLGVGIPTSFGAERRRLLAYLQKNINCILRVFPF